MATMMRVRVTLAHDDLEWAKSRALREGRRVSAVLQDALRAWRTAEARRDVTQWLGDGQEPITAAERAALERELTRRERT